MASPFISRVSIKNFRNYLFIDVEMTDKQVIIGENNVGKSNFIKAIQLILDPELSDQDRQLEPTDFFEGLDNPMEKGEVIQITIEIQNYSNNKIVLCQLNDATVATNPETLRITYKYFPILLESGSIRDYDFIIFKGDNEENIFTYQDRKYLNIKVIKPVRDMENEIKNIKKSPLNSLIKSYDIDQHILESVVLDVKQQNDKVLSMVELQDLTSRINERYKKFIELQQGSMIELSTADVNAHRILNTLKLLLSGRPIGETSLGLTNILYITLILLSIEERVIQSFIKRDYYEALLSNDSEGILSETYEARGASGYILRANLNEIQFQRLKTFMEHTTSVESGVTILVIEEPEAHLHPSVQRTLYRDVFQRNTTSVLLTTHSTHIMSITPLHSLIHLYKGKDKATKASSSVNLDLLPADYNDLSRYIDANRGEIYFGKAIIFVEGITEEYLIPRFAELLGKQLDYRGIVVCNIHSTNFLPYVKLVKALNIPYVVITDGDFFEIENGENIFGRMYDKKNNREFGFLGINIIEKVILQLNILKAEVIPKAFEEKTEIFNKCGFFIGFYTMEVDIMVAGKDSEDALNIICEVFNNLTSGGDLQKKNFREELLAEEYHNCIKKIIASNNQVGKGRFAQRLSSICIKQQIPSHVRSAIEHIYKLTDVGSYE